MAIIHNSDGPPSSLAVLPQNRGAHEIPIVLKETAEWLVLSKPPHWLSIPGRSPGSSDPSKRNPRVLLDWAKEKYGPLWTVHRLDRETSGLILFARTADAHAQANDWFQNRKTRKKYLCLAMGQPVQPILKLNIPIEGKHCLTQIEVEEQFEGAFLGRVTPVTGRRHQIRIHLSGAGYPILGDTLYGGPSEWGGSVGTIERVALHAYSLELPSGEKFEAPLPADFQFWLGQLRGRINE